MIQRLQRAFLLRAFQLLYHQLSWAYDGVSAVVSLGHWREWGAAALPFLPGPRVLDLGHGPGHLLVALSEGEWRPVGLDLSPQMGRQARRRLARLGWQARLVRGRGQSLPFAAASFDGVIAAFPSPYIVESQTISAVWRALRPGGRWIIVPEAALTGSSPPARAVERLYLLTGQRSATGGRDAEEGRVWERVLAGPGFSVAVHQVALPGSLVTVIVAERPSVS